MIKPKSYIVGLGLLLTLGAAVDGCSGRSSDQVTFESEYVSLQLPDSFVGGDPADPNVMAALKKHAEKNPDSETRADLKSYLDGLESDIRRDEEYHFVRNGPLLLLWGEPDKDGSMAEVYVSRVLVQNILPLTDGDSSMEALVKGLNFWPESEWYIDNLTADAAEVLLYHVKESPDDMTVREHHVFKATAEYVYEFTYVYYDEISADLDSVFASSADTATVKWPYNSQKQSVDQKAYRQDGDCESLVEKAKYALEKAYKELGTCDPGVVTPKVLSEIEPGVVFIVVEDAEAALAPEAATVRNEVAYWGDAGTYTVGSCSESGKTYGVFHDMADPGWYRVSEGGQPGSRRYEIPTDK